MAEEIIFKTSVDTGTSVKDIEKMTNELVDLNKAEQDLTKTTTNLNAKFEDVYGELQPLSGRLGELEDRMYELALANKTNTQEYIDLQAEVVKYRKTIIGVDKAVDQLAEQGRGLGAALQLGQGVVAGYGALQGTMALAGGESENLQKQLVKLQAVQAVLASLEELKLQLDTKSIVLTKAKSIAQSIYTTAVGTSTGALKAFRMALLATGIGAVIAGITLLIANWDKLTTALGYNTKAQTLQNEASKKAIESIGAELSASDKLSKVLKDEAVSREDKVKAVKQLQAEYPDLLANIDAENTSLDDINKALSLNTELIKLNAQVKALQDLRSEQYTKQLEAEVDAQTGANEGIINSLQAWGFGVDAKELGIQKSKEVQKESQKEIEVYDELENSLNKQIEALKEKGAVTGEDVEKEKKANEERKKAGEEWAKKQEELQAKEKERRRLLEDYMVQSITDESLRSIEALRLAHQREREELVIKFGEDTALLTELKSKQDAELSKLNIDLAKKEADAQDALNKEQLEKDKALREAQNKDRLAQLNGEILQLQEDFNAIQAKKAELALEERDIALQEKTLTDGEKFKLEQEYQKKLRDIAKETAEHDKKLVKEATEARVKITEDGLSAVQTLSDTVFSIRMDRAKKGSAEEERLAKRQFQINKALALSGAIMDGYKAITTSLALSPVAIGGVPNPAGIASLAFASITTASNIAKILASQYKSSGGGSGASGVSAPQIPSAQNEIPDGNTTLTAGLEGNTQGGQSVVLVVDSVTKAIGNKNQVDTISSIG